MQNAPDSPIRANIKIKEIYFDMTPKGEQVAMIRYSPGGDMTHLVEITARVEEMRPEPDGEVPSRAKDSQSAIGTMARVRWEAIEPAYKAFLSGQTLSPNGTPLATWSGMDARRVKACQALGISTIEELITAPESMVISLASRMPDARRYIDMAEKFLEAKSATDIAVQLEEKDDKITQQASVIDDLSSQMAEMRAMMDQLLGKQIAAVGDEDKPRRGRPPGSKSAPEMAEAAA
jgi:uncharacterized coiled-coil protein SlyX